MLRGAGVIAFENDKRQTTFLDDKKTTKTTFCPSFFIEKTKQNF